MIATLYTLGIFYVIIKYGLIILGVIIGIDIISAVVKAIHRVYLRKKAEKAHEEHSDKSLGAMIADAKLAVASGDMEGLESRRDYVDAGIKVIKWFSDVVNNGRYSEIRENDAKGEEPNYAIVMLNYSGCDFKEFSTKVIPSASGQPLAPTRCVAKDWKNGTEGQLWFYCPSNSINKLTIQAEDLSYELDKSDSLTYKTAQKKDESLITEGGESKSGKGAGKETAAAAAQTASKSKENGVKKANRDPEYTIVTVVFSNEGRKYDYICDLEGISTGDRVVVNVNDVEKTVRVMGVNIVKKSELKLPLEKYKHIIRKAGADAEDYKDAPDMAEDSSKYKGTADEDHYEDYDEYDEIEIRNRLQDAMSMEDYDVIQDMLDAGEIDIDDIDSDILVNMGMEEKEVDPWDEEEMINVDDPYICPVCFEPYDGIYCNNCGHSNDIIGAEELSDEDKFAMGIAAVYTYDKIEEEKESKAQEEWDMWADTELYDDDGELDEDMF